MSMVNQLNAERMTSNSELDSHASSIVVGDAVLITHDSGKTANVGPFTEQLGKLHGVPIVDCVVAHDCPYSKKTYYIAMYNVLYIKGMKENLIPPFVVRRQGNIVNDIPKIQIIDPTEKDHCLILDDMRVNIPLKLDGTISYFVTRKPSIDEYEEALTSVKLIDLNVNESDWNPMDYRFTQDEENMLDFEGRMIEPQHRDRNLIAPRVGNLQNTIASINLMKENEQLVQKISSLSMNDGTLEKLPENKCYDETRMVHLEGIDRTLEELSFAEDMRDRTLISKYQTSLKSKVSAVSMSEPSGITPKDLSKVFRIDLATAKRTLQCTSQRLKRSKNMTLRRRYTSNDRMLRYNHVKEFFYMDTMFATEKLGRTTRGNKCLQLFVTDKGFVFVVPLKGKGDVPQALRLFFKKVGVPDAIICDQSREQTRGESQKLIREAGTVIRRIEPNTPWSNRAELYIGLFKQAIRDALHETNCPMKLWDYCAEYKAKVNNATAKNLFQLQSRTPYQSVYKSEPDISNLCQFAFYDWCYYREETAKFPFPSKVLGRILGPSEGFGNEMAQWILRVDGSVISRQTARPLTEEETNDHMEVSRRKAFDLSISRKLGDSITLPPEERDELEQYDDDEGGGEPKLPDVDEESYDLMLNSEVILPHRDRQMHAVVVGRHRNDEGKLVGIRHENPILNTAVYDVRFPDGAVKQYASNVIAENLYAQVDMEGHSYLMLESIIDHRKNEEAINKKDQYFTTRSGQRRLRRTTKGWELCVLWKSGMEQWMPLKDLKASNPIEVADYAAANDLIEEPAFKWWVPYTLRRRDQIVSKVISRVKKRTHKYGVRIPRTVEEAYQLDKINGNNLWKEAIEKEMRNVFIAFELLEDNEPLPSDYKPASCHIIFDVKMDFT